MRRMRIGVRRVSAMPALTLALGGLGTGCQTSPATGGLHLNALSEADELRLGEEAAPQFLEEFGGEIPSEQIATYVREIGERMAAISERPDLPWEFYVVDSAVINAFALPAGKVFISRALLAEMTNEAQVAAVLGHEIGHVTDKHIGRQMTRSVATQLGLSLFGVALGTIEDETWLTVLGVGAEVTAVGTLLNFSRRQEHTADELGMRYMAELGYNPVGARQLIEILAATSGRAGLELFSTHPHPESRVERINELLAERYPLYDEPGRYELHEQRFAERVLAELKTLEPPRHRPAPPQ